MSAGVGGAWCFAFCFKQTEFVAGGRSPNGSERMSIILSTWPWCEGTALPPGTGDGLLAPGGEWEMFEGSRDAFQAYWAGTVTGTGGGSP